MNILFICSRNQWRSRTAETIFRSRQDHEVRSAGTEAAARIRVTEKLVMWADLVFVMEKRHKDRLAQRFGALMDDKEVIVLDIPDEYPYMDPELVEMLERSVAPYLEGR